MSEVAATPGVVLWLPSWARLREGVAALPEFAKLAARADRTDAEPGDDARLKEAFDIIPRPHPKSGLPVAALTRELDGGGSSHAAWLRADPGYVRPDMTSARLLACGESLALTQEEAEAFIKPLRTLFGDLNMPISAPTPSRWYLELSRDAKLPDFATPDEVLGDDLFQHLPEGDLGKRWKHLLNEAQTILHNHPLNAERAKAGKPPVNTLWFWGGGVLPSHVRLGQGVRAIHSDDVLMRALAARVPATLEPLAKFSPAATAGGTIVDLRGARDAAALYAKAIAPLLQGQKKAGFALVLQFADGMKLTWKPSMKWRFWRKSPPK